MSKQKPRTPEEFVDAISNDISWRKKELSDLKLTIQENKSSVRAKALIRSGVPVLYAHWEGFVKYAATLYITYLSIRRLSYAEVAPNFVALAMRQKLDVPNPKPGLLNDVVNLMLDGLSSRLSISTETAINTRSNLNSDVLEEIVVTLGIDYSAFQSKKHLIDATLLASRNQIAHGQYLEFDIKNYLELHDEVITLLETFRSEIEAAVLNKKYLRSADAC